MEPKELEASPEQVLLRDSFFGYSSHRNALARQYDTSFVHYTSAENAVRILQNKEVTLRSASLMNDYSEGHYGFQRVVNCLNHATLGKSFENALDAVKVGLHALTIKYFQQFSDSRPDETFMLSLSEHGSDTVDEDNYGRLSMWRAYGGDTNVALVLNPGPLLRPSDAIAVNTHPVLYADDELFQHKFGQLTDAIDQRRVELSSLGIERLAAAAAFSLFTSTLSTKHPGFSEEKEWRLIYSPKINYSGHLVSEVKSIGGVPQTIFKLPLVDYPDEGFWGVTIPDLLQRLIIGPTSNPLVLRAAFFQELLHAGVDKPDDVLWVSDVPIRR